MYQKTCAMQQLMNESLSRRSFLLRSMVGLSGLALSSLSPSLSSSQALGSLTGPVESSLRIPPLFCIAYVNPEIPRQANQEGVIARYPLAIVPQSDRPAHVRWRDRIKELNPKIIMLGYQMVAEQTTVPGPGHDKLRDTTDAWAVYPGGFYPTIDPGNGQRRRLFDIRKQEWQQAFLNACRATLESYPYDGLFLDQCSVFEITHPIPSVKTAMRQALQSTLLRLREEYPNTIFIGNSSYNWEGLNGELNEGNLSRVPTELAPFDGHAQPAMDMYVSRLRHRNDVETVKKEMTLVYKQGGVYAASVTYQQVLWFDLFDKVMKSYNTQR